MTPPPSFFYRSLDLETGPPDPTHRLRPTYSQLVRRLSPRGGRPGTWRAGRRSAPLTARDPSSRVPERTPVSRRRSSPNRPGRLSRRSPDPALEAALLPEPRVRFITHSAILYSMFLGERCAEPELRFLCGALDGARLSRLLEEDSAGRPPLVPGHDGSYPTSTNLIHHLSARTEWRCPPRRPSRPTAPRSSSCRSGCGGDCRWRPTCSSR